MRFPLSLTTSMAGYMARKKLSGEKRFPLVLMLEPLHACNLTCTGCGRIREYSQTIKEKLTVAECLAAVEECGAPIVSICGGEPLIYPEIGVRIIDPAVPANIMEDQVTRQLEEQLAITEDATGVTSTTLEGTAEVELYFDYGKDVDVALRDASTRLDRAKRFLPTTIDPPIIFKRDPSQIPAFAKVRAQLGQGVYMEKMNRARREWLDSLRRRTHVEVRL